MDDEPLGNYTADDEQLGNDTDDNGYPIDSSGIFIESRALSDIDLPTNINEDSYDSPSDSECDDTPRPQPKNSDNKYEILNEENNYNKICNKILLKYKWQKCIRNEENYGAFYANFQTEIMNNPFFKLTAGDFNDVLKKHYKDYQTAKIHYEKAINLDPQNPTRHFNYLGN